MCTRTHTYIYIYIYDANMKDVQGKHVGQIELLVHNVSKQHSNRQIERLCLETIGK